MRDSVVGMVRSWCVDDDNDWGDAKTLTPRVEGRITWQLS